MPKVIDLPTATTMDDDDYLIVEKSSGGTKKITRSNAVNLNSIGGRAVKYFPVPANSSTSVSIGSEYGGILLCGSVGGYGGVVIALRINNGEITHARNLIFNNDWSSPAGAVLSFSGTTLTITNNTSDFTRFWMYAG